MSHSDQHYQSRCVGCGYPKDAHLPDGRCSSDRPDRYSTMSLPAGQTCSSCGHFGFCRKFLGEQIATNTTCDWFPIRFVYPAPQTTGT